MPIDGINSDRLKFGQFLLDCKKIDMQILAQALNVQVKERLTSSYRRLGIILWKDFHVFKDRVELYHYLSEFEEYKEEIEKQYRILKYYSNLKKDKE